MNKTENYPPMMLSWAVWGLGAILYLIGFYQRVAPAVMTSELMVSFNIGATGLGNLSGIYLYSYVAMQVPTGILADRWGPRRLLSAGALVAGAGALVFAMAPSFIWAGMGRLLIGGSVAVAFVAMLKLAAHWFAPRHFALTSGMALFCGIIGAVFAGVPLRLLVSAMGWRPVMIGSGLITLAVAGLIWILVRDDPGEKGYISYAHAVSGIYNMGVMLGPMILQPAVGLILDLHSQGHGLDGMKQYSLDAYQLGFSLMLAWLVLGAVLILFTVETRCKQVE